MVNIYSFLLILKKYQKKVLIKSIIDMLYVLKVNLFIFLLIKSINFPIMNLVTFKSKLLQHKMKLKEEKEEYFYSIVSKPNPDNNDVLIAINQCFVKAYTNKPEKLQIIKSLVKQIFLKEKQPQTDINQFASWCISYFLGQRCLRPKVLILLVQALSQQNQPAFENLIQAFGLKTVGPQNIDNLKISINKIQKKQQKFQIWQKFKEIITQQEKYFYQNIQELLEGQPQIKQIYELQQLLNKARIFIFNSNKISQLFDTINNLGHSSKYIQNLVHQLTFPAFQQDLLALVLKIALKDPIKNYKQQLQAIIHYCSKQYHLETNEIIQILQMFYKQSSSQQIASIINQYRVKKPEQFIKFLRQRLFWYTNIIKKQYEIKFIDEILTYLNSIKIIQNKQNEIIIYLQNNIKSKIQSINLQFVDFCIDDKDLQDLILYYIKHNMQKFKEIIHNYQLPEQQQQKLIKKIKILKQSIIKQKLNDQNNNLNKDQSEQEFYDIINQDKLKNQEQQTSMMIDKLHSEQIQIKLQLNVSSDLNINNQENNQVKVLNCSQIAENNNQQIFLKQFDQKNLSLTQNLQTNYYSGSIQTHNLLTEQQNIQQLSASTFTFNRSNNPFSSQYIIQFQHQIQVLFIIISQSQITKIDIQYKKQHSQISKQKKHIVAYKFEDKFISLFIRKMTLIKNMNNKLKMAITYPKLVIKTRFQEFQINLQEIPQYKGRGLYVIKDVKLKIQMPNTFQDFKKSALLNSISQIIKNEDLQSNVIKWLALFYEAYNNKSVDQDKQVLKEIYINVYKSLKNTKYLIYFLRSVYKQESNIIIDIIKSKLVVQLNQVVPIQSIISQKYPQIKKLHLYYIFITLINFFQKYINTNDMKLYFNYFHTFLKLSNQSRQISSNLIYLTTCNIQIFHRYDKQIRKYLIDHPFITATDYFNIRIRYINKLQPIYHKNDRDSVKQHYTKLIIQIIQDLIYSIKNKAVNERQEITPDNRENMKTLILSDYNCIGKMGDNNKIGYIYKLSKQLSFLSNQKYKFVIDYIQQYIQKNYKQIYKKPLPQIMSSMLFKTQYQFDHIYLNKIFSTQKMFQEQIDNICQKFLRQQYKQYNLSVFLYLISILQNQQNQINYNSILNNLDKNIDMIQDEEHRIVIQNIISSFLMLIKFNQIPTSKIKDYFELYFNLKNQKIKNLMADKLIQQLYVTYSNKLVTILNLIYSFYHDFEGLSNMQKRQHIVNLYIQKYPYHIEETARQIFSSIIKNQLNLQSMQGSKLLIEPALNIILKQIQNDDVHEGQLLKLHGNLGIQNYAYLNQSLQKTIKNSYNKYSQLKNKLLTLKEIFSKKQCFEIDMNNMSCILQSLRSQKLNSVYDMIQQKYKKILEECNTIIILKQYSFWQDDKINNLQDILTIKTLITQQINKALIQFQTNTIKYQQFKKYFLQSNFKYLKKINNLIKFQELQIRLNLYNTKINKQYVQNLDFLCQALNFIHQLLNFQGQQPLLSKLMLCRQIKENYDSFDQNVHQIFQQIKYREDVELLNLFNLKNEESGEVLQIFLRKEQNIRIIKKIYECKSMFEVIKSKSFDNRSITYLKEYINDAQNSLLKIETIKQFESVIILHEYMKKSRDCHSLLININDFLNQKNIQIINNLQNCRGSIRLIEQKIDEALNQETSFKYQIKILFLKSTFIISKNLNIEIRINYQIFEKQKITTNNKINDGIVIIDYKILSKYKQKSTLISKDIQKQQQKDDTLEQIVQLLRNYQRFFKIIQKIQQNNARLTNYGYNPKELQLISQVIQGDYKEIQNHSNKLESMSGIWIKKIKQMYQKSYILTHFIGFGFSQFIERCLKKEYHDSLFRILDLTKQSFDQMYEEQQFSIKLEQITKKDPIERVQFIAQLFKKRTYNFLNKSSLNLLPERRQSSRQISYIYNKQQKSKPINLITCKDDQFYLNFAQDNKQFTKLAQVFYCQIESSFECLIYSTRTHYIVGAHKLQEEVKLAFCDLLSIILVERQQQLRRSQLCFIDNVTNDRLYAFITRPNLFYTKKRQLMFSEVKQNKIKLLNHITDAQVITSKRAGLGKTYYAQKKAKELGKKLRYFPVCGNIRFESLTRRLKHINLMKNEILLIQIGNVENKQKLQIFLSQLIIFKSFYFQQLIFIPEDIIILVQIQNIYEPKPQQIYHIINLLKSNNQIHHIKMFDAKLIENDSQNYDDCFFYTFLLKLNTKNLINTKDYSYLHDFYPKRHLEQIPVNFVELIDKYFVEWFRNKSLQPSFTTFKYFKQILISIFKIFSDLYYFSCQQLKSYRMPILKLQQFRQQFLRISIKNTLQFLQEYITTNSFYNNGESFSSFSDRIKQFPMLIIPITESFQFIYLDDQKVDLPIKSLLLSQNQKYYKKMERIRIETQIHLIFKQQSLNKLSESSQQEKIFRILGSLTGNKCISNQFLQSIQKSIELQNKNKNKSTQLQKNQKIQQQLMINLNNVKFKKQKIEKQLQTYKITLDNFYKMCLIIQRTNFHIPCIIMGESGVGKTALISFLVKVIYQQQLLIYNIHAGINEEKIQQWVQQFKEKAYKIKKDDEQNVQKLCKQQQNVKRSAQQKQSIQIMRQRVKSHYRYKRIWVFFDQFNTTDELSYIKEIIMDRRFQGQILPDNIVFLAACNPYRQKQHSNNRISAGIKKVSLHNDFQDLAFKVKPPPLSMIQLMWDYQQLGQIQNRYYITKILSQIKYSKKEKLISSIVYTHTRFIDLVQISSVSLRDVSRFKQLFNWFQLNIQSNWAQRYANVQQKVMNQDQIAQKAAILSFCFCYVFKYSTNSQRNIFLQCIQQRMSFERKYMKNIIQQEMRYYVNNLKLKGQKIAFNSALMENVFSSLVCLMNKIPILIIGHPGSSKSLSIKMLNSTLKGENSPCKFCQRLEEINMIYFQGSESSTSKGVQQVFQKAIHSTNCNKNTKWKIQNVILFDQIGLAQKSIHNPLKVLHSYLQTNIKQIGFIGISNWELDLAKMSRFLVLARSNYDQYQLKDTAVKIYQSFFEKQTNLNYFFQKCASDYFKFINKWNINRNHRQGFFGLRDFYSYIKSICIQIGKQKQLINEEQLLKMQLQAIQTNFDGQKDSLEQFNRIAFSQKIGNNHEQQLNPIQLVNKNLQNIQSRCLMLIIKGDSLVPIINQNISVNGKIHKVICIYGSTFEQDKQSQEYNLEVTQMIISYISKGYILAFKDINNSIQTSLYDLFNKSFCQIGRKRYCRIAVGANSNPKCFVHEKFNAVVYVNQQNLKNLDLPFLNRFEKHYLNLKLMILPKEIQILKQLLQWISSILSFKSQQSILKQQNFLINSSQQSLVTLIIKHRKQPNLKSRIQKIKMDLLKNSTLDFKIGINQQKDLTLDIQLQNIQSVDKCQKDLIIFTYDKFSNLSEQKTIFSNNARIIRLSEIKNEKQLRKQLKQAFQSQSQNVQLKLYYQSDYMHIDLVLFLAKQVKQQSKSQKQLIIIIQLHRFSIHHLNIEHINISYLHDYEQYFVEDLHSLEEINILLAQQFCIQIYQQRNLVKNFENYYTDTIKFIKFVHQNAIQDDLKYDYFLQIMQLSINPFFKQNCLKIIQHNLENKKIDFSLILINTEDILICSTVLEALQKYIEDMIKQSIFYNIKLIIQSGFLYYFNTKSLLKKFSIHSYFSALEHTFQIKKQVIYKQFQKKYHLKIDNLIKQYRKIRQMQKFQKGIQQNSILIQQQISFIPLSFKDFHLLFKTPQSHDQNSLGQIIMKLPFKRQQSNEAQYNLIVDNGIDFILSKFNSNKDNYLRQISQCYQLQCLYLFDILQYFQKFHHQSTQGTFYYSLLIVEVFKQYKTQQKIIMLISHNKLFVIIFNLISLLFQNIQAQKFIKQFAEIPKKSFGQALIEFCQQILDKAVKTIKLEKQTVGKFQSLEKYTLYFRSIFMKIRQILLTYKQFGLELSNDVITCNKLLQVFEKLPIDNGKLITLFMESYIHQSSLYSNIFRFITTLLHNDKIKSSKKQDIILNYLSLNIFSDWIQQINNQNSLIYNELEECIQNFVKLCNNHILFANNSSYFISLILNNLDEITQIQDLQNFFKNQNPSLFFKQQHIQNNSYFSISLGNYISNQIQITFQNKFKINIIEQQNYLYVTKNYLSHFIQLIDQTDVKNAFYNIYRIQFTKRYSQKYLILLQKNLQNQLQIKIDKILCQQNQVTRHLRLYLLKKIYEREKSMVKIKQKYIQIRKCQWIFRLKEYISQNQQILLIPPKVLVNDDQLYKYMDIFQQDLSSTKAFHDMIAEGLRSAQKTYELLTYFMFNFYSKSLPVESINILVQQLQNRQDLKKRQNKMLRELLKRYLKRKISAQICYSDDNNFMEEQIVLLNYINISVSCRTANNPLIQMLFQFKRQEQNHNYNYANYLQERYLIGSINNPALKRLQFIQTRHSLNLKASSYLKCIDNCDYIVPVGGTFYGGQSYGCEHPRNQFTCPLCGRKMVQAKTFKIFEYVKKYYPNQISSLRSTLMLRKTINFFKANKTKQQYSLTGYINGNTIQLLKQSMINKKNLLSLATDNIEQRQIVYHKLLETIIYFSWYLLTEFDILTDLQLMGLFKYNRQNTKDFLHNASYFYLKETNKQLKFSNKADEITWHLGLNKVFIQQFSKNSLKQGQNGNKNSLKSMQTRDKFQKQIEDLIFPYCEQKKERHILQTRRTKSIDKSGIIKEQGSLQSHLISYPHLNFYKIEKVSYLDYYNNMKNSYKETLNRNYPLLYYVMYNEDLQNKLQYYKDICIFLSRLYKMYNFKISREESKKSLQQCINQYGKDIKQEDRKTIALQMINLVYAWNKLAESNYELSLECHKLGILQPISQNYPLSTFLMDRKNLQNIEGRQLISFIKRLAVDYNEICSRIEGILKIIYPEQKNAQIFAELELNPTLILNESKMLELPIQFLNKKCLDYSSASLQYGISNPNYPFDQLQSMVSKQFYGCKYLVDQVEKFMFINYIGEQSHFITQLRQNVNQKTLQNSDFNKKITQFIKDLQKKQTSYKTIKNIQSSLENTIIYYKNFKNHAQISLKTLSNFIKQKNLKSITRQILEQPIASLPLCYLADFYEIIQFLTFEKIQTLLDSVYKKPLQKNDKEEYLNLLRMMKKQNRQAGIPSYKQFKIAIYRLAGRNLLLSMTEMDKYISEQLLQIQYYWPKGTEIQYFKMNKSPFLSFVNKTTISKIGQMISSIPFKDEKLDNNNLPNISQNNQSYQRNRQHVALHSTTNPTYRPKRGRLD